jgi:hypothetical protein
MLSCSRKLLKISQCEIGMKVVLRRPDRGYDIGTRNPALGTEWECVGTVEYVDAYEVTVDWENGTNNTYKDHELAVSYESDYNENEGKSSGSFISIW